MLYITIFGVLLIAAIVFFVISCWKRVDESGQALVITRANGEKKVTFGGGIVIPMLQMAERVDLTRKRIGITRKRVGEVSHLHKDGDLDPRSISGSSLIYNGGLICKDNILAYMDVEFYLSINPVQDDILKVVKHFTAARASSTQVLAEHFGAKFSEALKTVVRRFDYEELVNNRDDFRNKVIELLEKDMDGFVLNEVAIENIEQAPMEDYHKDNILEVAGLRKIVDITSVMNIRTAELLQTEETEVKKKTTDGERHRLSLTRSLEEDRARNEKEIEVIRIKERTEREIAARNAKLELESKEVENSQLLELAKKKQEREIAVADFNNQKVLQVQQEEVRQAQQVAHVVAEKVVLEQSLEKQTFEEKELTRIAGIKAERTKIERSIVEETEATLNTQNSNALERKKLSETLNSEAKATAAALELKILAEAKLEASKKDAQRDEILASNRLAVSKKDSEARVNQAEAKKAEAAAIGLSDLIVREHSVAVKEKELTVEQKAIEIKAKEVSMLGGAEAERIRQMGAAEAERVKQMGIAEAEQIRQTGVATAESERARYEAMASITPETREHELAKMNVEKARDVELAQVQSSVTVAQANATVMAEAMKTANIKLIGGGEVFDQIRRSIFAGESLDAKFDSSNVLQTAFKSYENGTADFVSDLKSVLQKSDVSTGSVGSLALAQAAISFLTSSEKGRDFLSKVTGFGVSDEKSGK